MVQQSAWMQKGLSSFKGAGVLARGVPEVLRPRAERPLAAAKVSGFQAFYVLDPKA